MADEMMEPATGTSAQSAASPGKEVAGESLVCAFNEVRQELVSTLYYMLGNQEDALDALQNAFIKCWQARNGVAEIRNLRAWIFRVGVNAAKDLQRNAWYRRAKPLAGAALNRGATGCSPVEEAGDREFRERLEKALLQLRPDEREVFLLKENNALTYEEIADLRQRPVGTIKTQMRTALRKLRELLQESTDVELS
jgi:RNA polymerase sigma-70 factor (ECF subfamily)